MAQLEQEKPKLTPALVLMTMQKSLQRLVETSDTYDLSEPFPIEITELFLYSPDGAQVLLVFPFLGQDFVLSETEIATERNGEVVVINDPLKQKILEYLILRLKIIRDLSL